MNKGEKVVLKAIVVDDEILAIHLLQHLLVETGAIEVVASYTTAEEGLRGIRQFKPDVAFLDIEMPVSSGIELAGLLQQQSRDGYTDIVFVTAFDAYALDAFTVQAFDYLLKPIDKERLRLTVERIVQRRKWLYADGGKERVMKASFMGQFRLFDVNNQSIKWRTKKVKELCAYLLHHQVPVHRAQIVEELWPNLPVEKAANHLHTSIYQLRKELKQCGYPDAVAYVNESYSLHVAVSRDVDNIEKLLAKAVAEPEAKLLELYPRDYLDLEDYPWAVAKQVKLRKSFIDFLERVVQTTPACPIVKNCLDKLIEMEPFEEQYIRGLMQYYRQLGKPKSAVEVYERFEVFLSKELGEIPQKETRDLMKKCSR